MYTKIISLLYILKKNGKFNFLFIIYRYLIIFKKQIFFLYNSLFFLFFKIFSYDLSENEKYFNHCKYKIANLVEVKNSIYNKNKINSYKKITYNIFENLMLSGKVNEKIFIDICGINQIFSDHKNWIKNRKFFLDWLLINQKKVPDEMKNIRFISATDLFNTIGLIYTIDGYIKSVLLGFTPKYKLYCLVHREVRGKAINQFLIDKFSKYIEFIYDDIIINKYKPYEGILNSFHGNFTKLENEYSLYAQSGTIKINQIWYDRKNKPLFNFTSDEIELGWKNLYKYGVKKNDWFVAVHVRDPSFKGVETHRDVDIADYFKSFKSITSRGGWVIRLGDSKVKPLPKLKNVIDYPISNIRSDFMDIFISSKAKFMIGTSSGMSAVSSIFDTPVAMTNYQPLMTLYLKENDLYLPRLLKLKKTINF